MSSFVAIKLDTIARFSRSVSRTKSEKYRIFLGHVLAAGVVKTDVEIWLCAVFWSGRAGPSFLGGHAPERSEF